MPVIFCKECKETIYLDPHTYWTISDTTTRCEKCYLIQQQSGSDPSVDIDIDTSIRIFVLLVSANNNSVFDKIIL